MENIAHYKKFTLQSFFTIFGPPEKKSGHSELIPTNKKSQKNFRIFDQVLARLDSNIESKSSINILFNIIEIFK